MLCWDSMDKISPRLRIYNLSNPSTMYCNTYVNSYDAIGSVIPCEKWHKHQCFHSSATAACSTWGSLWTGATISVSWNRNFPNKEVRLLHSPVRSRLSEWVSELHVPGFPGSSLVSAASAGWFQELMRSRQIFVYLNYYYYYYYFFFFFSSAWWWYCVHAWVLQWQSCCAVMLL